MSDNTSPDVARHLRITGRVQGVSYRAWTQDRARTLGLSGWVRNESDGSVTALVQGPEEAIAALIRAAQDGPTAARVSAVNSTDAAPDDTLTGFGIRR